MLGVICLHSTQAINPNGINISVLLYETASISIPLFFMVSGFLLIDKSNYNIKYSIKKILNIIRLVISVNLIYWLLIIIKHIIIYKYIDIKLSFLYDNISGCLIQKGAFWIYWYLGSMIILYLLLPIINKLYKNKKKFYLLTFALFLTECISFYFNISNQNFNECHIIQTFRIWNWLFYFNLGGCIKLRKPNVSNYLIILCCLSFFLNIIIQANFTSVMYIHSCEFFYSSIPLITFAYLLFIIIMDKCKMIQSRFISSLSNLFIPVFTLHPFIINIFHHSSCKIFDNSVLLWIFVSFITITISFILMKVQFFSKLFKI